MGVVIELSEVETPRFLPPPEFSVPFVSPSLRWGSKKRLRCFNPAAALRFSPSPSDCRRSFCPGSTNGPCKHGAASPTREPPPKSPLHSGVPCAQSPSTSFPTPSGRPRGPIRLTYPPEDREEGPSAPPPVSRPDLSSRAPGQTAEARDEASRPRGGALGWSLRSRVEIEEGRRKKRKVELWVSLSRDEIEEDFLWMTSAKPPRRSRRRSKLACDKLQGIFPGSWLPSKVTTDRYKVSEPWDCRKVRVDPPLHVTN